MSNQNLNKASVDANSGYSDKEQVHSFDSRPYSPQYPDADTHDTSPKNAKIMPRKLGFSSKKKQFNIPTIPNHLHPKPQNVQKKITLIRNQNKHMRRTGNSSLL